MQFQGFTKESYEFLFLLGMNNNREYFHQHHDCYVQHVLTPFRQLAMDLGPFMLEIDDKLDVRPASGPVISRINRDTRFSNDKSPYRDHMWIAYRYPKQYASESFSYFFELSPAGSRLGMGMYCQNRQRMDELRAKAKANPAKFERIITAPALAAFELGGDRYKRPVVKEVSPAADQYLNRKYFYLTRPVALEDTYRPELVDLLKADFSNLRPLYDFIVKAK